MGSETYLVRIRGRVMGPYSLADLHRMVQRGDLSRIHEISLDGTSWAAAGDLGEVFPVLRSTTASCPAPNSAAKDDGLIPLKSLEAEYGSDSFALPYKVKVPRESNPSVGVTAIPHRDSFTAGLPDVSGMPQQFTIGGAMSLGWHIMWSNYGSLLGATFLTVVIQIGISFLNLIPGLGLVVFLIIGPPLGAGLMWMSVIAFRHGKVQVGDMFCGFSRFGGILGITYLRLALLLGCAIPFALATGIMALFSADLAGFATIAWIIGLAVSLILILGVGLRLTFSEPICLESELGVIDSMRRSWAITRPIAGMLLLFFILVGLIVMAMVLVIGLAAIALGAFATVAAQGTPNPAVAVALVLLTLMLWIFFEAPFLMGCMGAAYGLAAPDPVS